MFKHRHPRTSRRPGNAARLLNLSWFALSLLFLPVIQAYAQDPALISQNAAPANRDPSSADNTASTVSDKDALQVNWLYGSFVPKEVPLIPLTLNQRWALYMRSTYTTPGIYVKTVAFTLSDQVKNNPSEWGRTFDGFAKRVGTREAQFVLQNSLTAAGDAVVGWEPRYDRCHCTGFWPRTRHAVVRNFVTYGGEGQRLRPQIMSYAAAFGAAVTTATWIPRANLVVKGYQGAVTQVFVGIGVDWLAEFAPEIGRALHLKKGILN